jgi:hypothetical protein
LAFSQPFNYSRQCQNASLAQFFFSVTTFLVILSAFLLAHYL